MNRHNPKLIDALLDGEVRGPRRWLLERHLRCCPMCAAEYRRLHHVRQMLKANPPAVEMCDSPEFFWSKIKRQIDTGDDRIAQVPMSMPGLFGWIGQHQMALASAAVAVVCLTGALLMWRTPSAAPPVVRVAASEAPQEVASVEEVTTAIPETVATAVATADSDVAVIWVSGLPWTPDMSELKTRFANLNI